MAEKKKRLKVNKVGEFSSAHMQSRLGPLTSAVLLTQRRLINDKKKRKKNSILPSNMAKRVNEDLDKLIEYIEAFQSPELDDTIYEELEKCHGVASKLIKDKAGAWRRINGAPVFICKDGTIHAGPRVFIGKNVKTLADDLKVERKKKGKKPKGGSRKKK